MKNVLIVALLFSVQACLAQDCTENFWLIRIGDDIECSGIHADFDGVAEIFTVQVYGQIGISQAEVERAFFLNDIPFVSLPCGIIVPLPKGQARRNAEDSMMLAIEAAGLIDKCVEYLAATR